MLEQQYCETSDPPGLGTSARDLDQDLGKVFAARPEHGFEKAASQRFIWREGRRGTL